MDEHTKRAIVSLARQVAPVYVLLGWRWSVKSGKSVPLYVPTEEDIREALVRLYEELSAEVFTESASFSVSTGGLEVRRYRDEGQAAHCVFGFKLEEEVSVGHGAN